MKEIVKDTYKLLYDETGKLSFCAQKISLPDLKWSFFHRPITNLASLKPSSFELLKGEDLHGTYDELIYSYAINEGLKAKSIFRAYGTMLMTHLEIENSGKSALSLMLFSLLCEKPELSMSGRPLLRTYSAGSRALNAGIPSELQISPLMPQLGLISADTAVPSLLLADIGGNETFNILLDSPFNGSISCGFPVEDESSCGRRTLPAGGTYITDRIFIQESLEEDPVESLSSIRDCWTREHPPRRNPAADKIKSWWNSWYAYKSGINEAIIKKAIDFAAETGLDAVELDEGWMEKGSDIPPEAESQSWEVDRKKFPGGMEEIVRYASERGVKVMLWCRPYMITPDEKVFAEHPEAFLRRSDGSMIYWVNGYLLDPAHPFTGEYLKRGFARYNKIGIAGYKVDFLGPLIHLQNRHFKEGLMQPGKWMRLLFEQLAEAIGRDRLIHCSTPMAPSAVFQPYCDSVRSWGDNDPYYHRGLYGYAALPLMLALNYRTGARPDPDMGFPTEACPLLCEKDFIPELFMDALGSSFVSGAFYLTENFENFSPERRRILRILAEAFKIRAFKPDDAFGCTVFRYEDEDEFIVFSRIETRIAVPAKFTRRIRVDADCIVSTAESSEILMKKGSILLAYKN